MDARALKLAESMYGAAFAAGHLTTNWNALTDRYKEFYAMMAVAAADSAYRLDGVDKLLNAADEMVEFDCIDTLDNLRAAAARVREAIDNGGI